MKIKQLLLSWWFLPVIILLFTIGYSAYLRSVCSGFGCIAIIAVVFLGIMGAAGISTGLFVFKVYKKVWPAVLAGGFTIGVLYLALILLGRA